MSRQDSYTSDLALRDCSVRVRFHASLAYRGPLASGGATMEECTHATAFADESMSIKPAAFTEIHDPCCVAARKTARLCRVCMLHYSSAERATRPESGQYIDKHSGVGASNRFEEQTKLSGDACTTEVSPQPGSA